MRSPRRARAGLLVASSLVAALLSFLAAPARPAAAAAPASIDLVGHGWGHGRGLGQWGALGYARQGWTATQILEHFYGKTTGGAVATQQIPIRLENLDGTDVIVQSTAGLTTSASGATVFAAARIRQVAGGWAVDSGPGCAGPWAQVGTSGGPITLSPTADTNGGGATVDQMLQACQPNSTIRWYRGTITGTTTGSTRIAVNTVDLERYLVSVVGSEMSAGWADIGGAAALQAQAVAARSYVLAENRGLPAYRTADSLLTSCCQVYSGAATQTPGGARQSREDARVASAVTATAGQVRMFGGSVARTEYSASTGGWTVASTHSDAVVDDGDAVSTPGVSGGTNPRHTWTASIPRTAIEAAFAPAGGALTDIAVTARNGLGDLGGRVTQVRMQFTNGIVDVSGTTFKTRLYCNCATGPLSDWFAFTNLSTPSGGIGGYWIVDATGGVFSFGRAAFYGSTGGTRLNSPILGMTGTPKGFGYWLVAGDGGIFAYGDAAFYGSTGNIRLNRPIVGMAVTPTGKGYWIVASDGGIFAYGDAVFYGSTGNIRLNRPVVGMAVTPTGKGYWLVASDGGIFAYGDAAFHGSTGNIRLNQPIVGMASTPSGGGYWMVAADGGLFAFGNAGFAGSLPSRNVVGTAIAIAPTATGGGYLIAVADGSVQAFGDAPSMGGIPGAAPSWRGRAVGLATVPT
jgi:SpoIID/LytB domain protein